MNGLRISGRQVMLQQVWAGASGPAEAALYRMLAEDRINISFLSADYLGPEKLITCLAEPETFGRAGRELADRGSACTGPEAASACVLSLFPHRCDPSAAGALLEAMALENVDWRCMATSGSMLSLVIDCACAGRAADAAARHIDLPESRGPANPGLEHDPIARSLKTAPETVARYAETRISTYGIRVEEGLVLCSVHMKVRDLAGHTRDLAGKGFVFRYASAVHAEAEDAAELKMVLEAGKSGQIPAGYCRETELISFHGPHFGDRYGIADKAIGGLERAGVPVLLAGCVGATVSIALPPGSSGSALDALSEKFETP